MLHRMTAFWSYFAASCENSTKLYKRIKKAKRIETYESIVQNAF